MKLGGKTRYRCNQIIPVASEESLEGRCQTFNGLLRYDLETGENQRYDYGDGVCGSESPVAAVQGSGSDSDETRAYPVLFPTDINDWQSYRLIFDAADIRQPIARVTIPRRISIGFHTTWVDGKELRDAA